MIDAEVMYQTVKKCTSLIRFRSKTLPYITLTAWKYCKAVNNEVMYQIVNIDNKHGLTYKVQCEFLNTKVRLY